MTAIIDYGVGNLFSLVSSLKKIGEDATVTSDVNVIKNAQRLILPGVGAFGDAIDKLKKTGLDTVLKDEAEKGKPIMGICLGMQLLFEKSFEYGEYDGLGFIKGRIIPISEKVNGLKIPHMGWNSLNIKKSHPLFKYIKNGDHVYFVHSYFATECEHSLLASSEYGTEITAVVAEKNVMGCQFHPEKSGKTGLDILKAFCETEEGVLC